MNKKWLIGGVVGLLVCAAPIHAATEYVRANFFAGNVVVNNQIVAADNELLSYQGSVYAPVRAIAEAMKGYVSYDSTDKTVYIERPTQKAAKSTLHSKKEEGPVTLHLFSEKSEYVSGEPIHIWSRLSNTSDTAVELHHSSALLLYSITDQDGFTYEPLQPFDLVVSEFQPDEEYASTLDPIEFVAYNTFKQRERDPNLDIQAYLKRAVRPATLPPGEYTLTLKSSFRVGTDPEDRFRKVQTSIQLTVTEPR